MAEKIIYIDENHNKNSIIDARIPIVTIGTEHDEDAINRKFVVDSVKYDTTLATTLPTAEKMGGIEKDTPSTSLNGKSIKEVLDLALYPLKSPIYVLPTLEATITNMSNIVVVGGFKSNIILKATPTLNDASGIVSYTFSGSGIVGTVTQATDTYTVPNYVLQEGSNSWVVGVNYSAPIIKNNTHGIADNSTNYPSGLITKSIVLEASLPIKYGFTYGLEDITVATPMIGGMEYAKVTLPKLIDNKFRFEIASYKPVSLNIAIPKINVGVKVTLDNGIDITDSFKSTLKTNFPTYSSDLLSTYTVFHHYSNVLYSKSHFINVEVLPIKYASVYTLRYDVSNNKVSINGELEVDAWNDGSDITIPFNALSVYRYGDAIRVVSNYVGDIKKIEITHPHTIIDGLAIDDYTTNNIVGIGNVGNIININVYV